jgi:hypothetical protein
MTITCLNIGISCFFTTEYALKGTKNVFQHDKPNYS